MSAARWVVLPPGAAHRSSMRSPGCGSSDARHRHRGARLGHEQALPPIAARRTRRTARRGPAPRAAGRRAGWATGEASPGRSASCSVLARTRGLRGLVAGRHQRARVLRAERVAPQLGDPQRVGVLERGFGGRGVGQRGDERRRLARGAAQHGVDEARAAARASAWRARPTRRPRRGRGRGRGRRAGTRRAAARRSTAGSSLRPAGRRAARSGGRASPRRWTAP